MAESYGKRVMAKAWAMTSADFGLQNARRVVIRATLTIFVLAVLFMFGALDEFIAAAGKSGATLGVLAVALSFFYVLNLYRAAAEMQKEAEDKAERLRKQLDDKESRQAAINDLWRLRSDGIALRNRRPTPELFQDWQHDYENWRVTILAEAGRANINLRNWLDRIDQMPPGPADFEASAISGEHRRLGRIMSEMLRRTVMYLTRDLYASTGDD